MHSKHRLFGVIAALGISLTAGIALPMVNVLKEFSTSELMMIRGGITALFIAVVFRKRVTWTDWRVLTFSGMFAVANLCLYNGIRAWGANSTIVIITLTPIVNFVAKWWRGEKASRIALICLLVLITGVLVALEPWHVPINVGGAFWSLSGAVLAGLGFEVLAKTKDLDPYARGFWLSIVIGSLGFLVVLTKGFPLMNHEIGLSTSLLLVGFGLTGGLLYFLANIFAFDYLDTEVASVLAMGETPAVILGAGILLGEKISVVQWSGVILALAATMALSFSEAKKSTSQATKPAA